MSELLSVKQVAKRLGTSERFPRRLVAERRIEFIKVGRHVRIRSDVLEAWLAAQTVGAVEYGRRF